MAFEQTSNPLYSEFIQLSRYSRWLPEEKRRENWNEVVNRWFNFWVGRFPEQEDQLVELAQAIFNLDVMPSMRTLMTAGPALDRDEIAGYNCSYLAIGGPTKNIIAHSDDYPDEEFIIPLRDIKAFDEMVYVLMNGVGVGFSVERQYINNLPTIGNHLSRSIYKRTEANFPGVPKEELSTFSSKYNMIYVHDSRYGWASAVRILLAELYNGNFSVQWDVSKIRPAGTSLKTFGGRASGPDPLVDLFTFCVEIFKKANGRKLTSIECHDVCCKIADIVVVGGVRRSALISLSNLSDHRMRQAKSGAWWEQNPHRALANNSVCYTEKPDSGTFMAEWLSLYESKSGERGIFNRQAANNTIPERRRKTGYLDWGCNPCCIAGDSKIDVLIDDSPQTMVIKDIVDYFKVNQNIKVKTFDFETNSIVYKPIVFAGMTRPNTKVLKITDTDSGKSIKVTPDHQIWTENRGWVEAQFLQSDDVIKIN